MLVYYFAYIWNCILVFPRISRFTLFPRRRLNFLTSPALFCIIRISFCPVPANIYCFPRRSRILLPLSRWFPLPPLSFKYCGLSVVLMNLYLFVVCSNLHCKTSLKTYIPPEATVSHYFTKMTRILFANLFLRSR